MLPILSTLTSTTATTIYWLGWRRRRYGIHHQPTSVADLESQASVTYTYTKYHRFYCSKSCCNKQQPKKWERANFDPLGPDNTGVDFDETSNI